MHLASDPALRRQLAAALPVAPVPARRAAEPLPGTLPRRGDLLDAARQRLARRASATLLGR